MSLLGQYKYVIDKSHPRANADGAVYMHMIVAEQKLGRHLFPEEVVHHRDLNKLNNSPENLIIFASNGDHSRFHMSNCDESILELNSNGVYVCNERKFYCVDCGIEITRDGIRCKNCSHEYSRKVERPASNELLNVLNDLRGNFTKAGKLYGVTDNAVRKWCDSYGLSRKSVDYK